MCFPCKMETPSQNMSIFSYRNTDFLYLILKPYPIKRQTEMRNEDIL